MVIQFTELSSRVNKTFKNLYRRLCFQRLATKETLKSRPTRRVQF